MINTNLMKQFLVCSFFILQPSIVSHNLMHMVEVPNAECLNILTFKNLKKNGSLDPEFLKFLSDNFGSTLFIETGTYIGDTAFNASKSIPQVITIELSKQIFKQAQKRFENVANVTLYNGDSKDILSKISIDPHEKVIFWLDGHYSSGNTARGDLNTPIIQELECVKKLQIKDAVILIDDIRFFQTSINNTSGTAYSDYPEIAVILNKVLEINEDYKCVLLGDILMCYIPKSHFTISPAAHACTLSRIWDSSMFSLKELHDFEEILINQTTHEEKRYFSELYHAFIHEENGTHFGLNKYFNFWHGLLHLSNAQKSNKYFRQALDAGFDKNRINYYLEHGSRIY